VSAEHRFPSIASILPLLPRIRIVDVGAMWTGPDAARTLQQTSWGDAVYVRDFPAFDGLEPPALLKLAAILHENYRSCGLAARVLGAYDRKMRTDLQSAYARLMASHI